MTRIYSLSQIEAALPQVDVVKEIGDGFVSFSKGEVEVPPVGELMFPENSGEMHIKYGAVHGDDVFVVKLATGFFKNPELGLPPFGGCMLVLSQKTGMVEAVLLEEGELTNHRTAAAGAVAANALAPKNVQRIGIVGSGVQARLQAEYLQRVTDCRDLSIWARNEESVQAAAKDLRAQGYAVRVPDSLEQLCAETQLIVTTTPAETPLLTKAMVQPGTHITAMGSDTPGKNEIAPEILAMADVVVGDSLAQCQLRGEIFQACKVGAIASGKAVELGAVIADPSLGRSSDEQITIADLTGVAVQDIAIAKAVMNELDQGT
ncbi:MAG: ornithine cyclodeaminase family protein [Litoreibacter sp.]